MSKFILNLPPQIIFLKTGCNIPLNSVENSPIQLVMEIGNFGISLMWINSLSMEISGLSVYVFEVNDDPADIIRFILQSEEFKNAGAASVKLFYNYKESLLVPDKYFNEELNAQMLSLLFGEDENAVTKFDVIEKMGTKNIYRVPAPIENIVNQHISNHTVMHSTSIQLRKEAEGTVLNCIVFYDAIKVLLYINGQLYFVQQFKYNSPEDVTYHLLNTCKQHDIKPSEIKLNICGMIIEDSNLYQHLYNYFLNINFISIAENIAVREEISNLPSHFFSHLTELALCEL
jgi:hypothetical protein